MPPKATGKAQTGTGPKSGADNSQQTGSTFQAASAHNKSNTTDKTVPLPPWNLTRNSQPSDKDQHQQYKSLVYHDCPVNPISDKYKKSERNGERGTSVKVATNYLAVEKIPDRIYVYNIEYVQKKDSSTDESTTTKSAQNGKGLDSFDELRKAVPEDNTQTSDDTSSVPADTTVSEQPHGGHERQQSDIADVSNDDGTSPPQPPAEQQTRKVTRRSEQRYVWDALKQLSTGFFCHNAEWATDLNTLWSLKPLRSPGDPKPDADPSDGEIYTLEDVDYHKFSGHKATLSRVDFAFNRVLHFTPADKKHEVLINSDAKDDKGASMHIAALNGLISKHPTDTCGDDIVSVGPNKFYFRRKFRTIEEGLNANRGYVTSVRPGTERILLNVGTLSGSFFQSITVSEFLSKFSVKEYGGQEGVKNLLKGRAVRVMYDRVKHWPDFNPNLPRNRYKVIAGFGDYPSDQKFIRNDGTETTVREYFVDELGAPEYLFKDPYPCVNVGLAVKNAQGKAETGKEDKSLWIPAQFLQILPDQPFNRQLGRAHMAAMLKAAQHRAAQTQNLIVNEGLPVLGIEKGKSNSVLDKVGIKITHGLLEIPARILETIEIRFKDSSTQASEASWNLVYSQNQRNNIPITFARTPDANSPQHVHVLDLTTRYGTGAFNAIGKHFTSRLNDHGIAYKHSQGDYTSLATMLQEYETDRNVESQLPAQLLRMASGEKLIDVLRYYVKPIANKGTKLLFLVVLEDDKSSVYGAIKRAFDQHLGRHTICLTMPKMYDEKQDDWKPWPAMKSIFSNLALKVNGCKLGGQNHKVAVVLRDNQQTPYETIFEKFLQETIVIGVDVAHPNQMLGCPSVAAVVGSVDEDLANFPGSMRLQKSKDEIIRDLSSMICERIKQYVYFRKSFPRRLLFYRDGVGEDQYDEVRTVEIDQVVKSIESARNEIQAEVKRRTDKFMVHNDKVSLTFIVVGKRHNTRFFCRTDKEVTSFKNGNVKPGLLVDTVITRPAVDEYFDFFLQSHVALQGTAKSAHYVVLRNDTPMQGKAFTAEEIQRLTHAFCYNFARATKGVSYASPAYYADRLAERGTHYLKTYTDTKDTTALQMTDEQKKRGKDGLADYARRLAADISNSPAWIPQTIRDRYPGRMNPWHPNLDDSMFWL